MKSLVSILAVSGILLTASAAMADTYSTYPLVGACTTVSRDLSTGDRGSDVTTLQTFLVNQNYPGGGTWMITGYFGAATRQAVRNFQAQQDLPVTGTVGPQTRAAISRVSCGGYSGTDLSNPLSYIYGTLPTPVAASATIIPTTQPAVPVYTLPTTTTNCGTYSILYGYNINCPSTTPTITYLNPVSGGIGDRVTVYGSGFSATGNTVRFGNGIITSLISPDGQSVSFTVPSQLSGFGSQPVGLGTYPVSVSNAAGLTSGTLPFTVTSLGSGSAPTISSVNGPAFEGQARQMGINSRL
jgi:peptidoglycan hydrolase-like protein with peptidoglycan-binding domain